MTNTAEEKSARLEALRARSSWYRLLAGVFAEEPQEAFLHELRSESCVGSLKELGARFDADFLSTDPVVLKEALACEYTMLFVAPGGFPAVESVRLQGGYKQQASSEVKAMYTKEGYAVKPGRFTTFDDHLAVELGFIAALLERQAEALLGSNDTEARRLEKRVKQFWVQHLGRWVRGFAELVESAADHSFYREMASLLHAFALAELALLQLTIDDSDGGNWRAPRPEAVDKPIQCGGVAQ